jgi:protein subunit release factor B
VSRELLFSVTASDCTWSQFRVGGAGGQHRDKTSAGVRCVHPPSGAVGQASEDRSQAKNKSTAFARMAETSEFKAWHKRECALRTGAAALAEEALARSMRPHNIRTEVHDERGRWVQADPNTLESE